MLASEKTSAKESLLDRVGGYSAVELAVVRFYEKVLKDPLLAPFFANSNLDQQRKRQAKFLASVMSGNAVNVENYMRNAHRPYVQKMGLTDEHFDAVAGHLRSTLTELGVAGDALSDIMTAVGSLRAAVLCR